MAVGVVVAGVVVLEGVAVGGQIAAAAGVAIGAASAYAVRSKRKKIMGNAAQPVATPSEKEAK